MHLLFFASEYPPTPGDIATYLGHATRMLSHVDHAPRYRFPDYWVGQMECFWVKAADALLSPSQHLTDRLLAQPYTNQPIEVIPYPGCDPSAAPIFQQYAPDLLNLINASSPQYLWEHPTRLSQSSTYHTLQSIFFRLASRPGLRWLNRWRRPLRKLYTRWRT